VSLDLVIDNARVPGQAGLVSIGIEAGQIVALGPAIVADAPREDAGGRLVCGGLIDCHIHLDKADILAAAAGAEHSLEQAVEATARLKAGFTAEDVYERAKGVVEQAITHGTTAMRSFVEIDPRAGLRSFEALKAIRSDFAWAMDIEICAFAQEGLTNELETESLLASALADGADLVGGCTYTDSDPVRHVARIFDLAEHFDVDADFHVDFDLDPIGSLLPEIIDETKRRGWQGRVVCGHATKLSALPAAQVAAIGKRLADAGIGIVALPATDLFLLGRSTNILIPRGVAPLQQLIGAGATAAVATNNVLNPFTPYGDANLIRMANLFANVAQLASDAEMDLAFDLITAGPARLMQRAWGLAVGSPADFTLIDALDPADAMRRVASVLAAWKAGHKTFERPPASILRPQAEAVVSSFR
jgi:cytosine/creatinine deaminase